MSLFLFFCTFSILIAKSQTAIINGTVKSGIRGDNYRWSNGVHFQIASEYSQSERDTIVSAIVEIQKAVCIRITHGPNPPESRDFVFVARHSTDCNSHIGRQGGTQHLNLAPSCLTFESALHETYHALGFFHEMSRPDRDNYITIHWENIAEKDQGNFALHSDSDTFGVGYDFYSIMHYPRYHKSSNNQPTMTAKDPARNDMGRQGRLTDSDKLKLQRMYNCNKSTKITLYADINHTGESIDIEGTAGECKTVPQDNWNDRTSSVHTHDNCFILWENHNCGGKSVRAEPGTPSHSDLRNLGFNDIISAVQPCPR